MSSLQPKTAHKDEQLDKVFRALSHSVRRQLLARLSQGEGMISELAEPFQMSFPAVSKHLRVLEQAGLVAIEVDGRVHRCTLRAEPLRAVEKWLELYRVFWNENLDALAQFLENENQSESPQSKIND